MSVVLKDRVLESTTTTGTGAITLSGAVTGYQSFSAVGNGNDTIFVIYAIDGSGNPSGDWEVSQGVYTSAGTTLSRDTVYASSNSGSLVNFSAGTKRVACAPAAAMFSPNALLGIFGGTGHNSMTDGDLLYGQTPDAWARLGIGATGTALCADGSAPSWSDKVGLGTAISTDSALKIAVTHSSAGGYGVNLQTTIGADVFGYGLFFNALYAGAVSLTNALVGLEGRTTNAVAQTMSTAVGNRSAIYNTSTGTITTAFGFQATVYNPSGTIATRYGMYIADTAGTTTTQYGIFLENMDGATTNIAIFSSGGASFLLAGAAGVIPLTIRGAASQTGYLLQFQNSTPAKLCGIGPGGMYNCGPAVELTIASGAITVTKSFHKIDTQSDAATDDLDTINGGVEGDILVLRAENSARDVVVKDGTGNLQLAGDFTLDNVQDSITLIYDGSNWLEISRSDNSA